MDAVKAFFNSPSLDSLKTAIVQVVRTVIERHGYVKPAILLIIIISFIHTVLKYNGLLRKKSLRGEHVFITGAGMGIGRKMSLILGKLGCKLTLADLNMEAATSTENELKKNGVQVHSVKCDVSNPEEVHAAAEKAREKFGDVTILINNAGIVSGKPLMQNPNKMIEKVIAVNTTAHAYTVKEFLPAMMQKNHGHIVTIASSAGTCGVPLLADYCASKFGAVGFDESLRVEMKKFNKKVRTTCICPFFINTGMFDGCKSKFNWLIPILEEDYAAWRIITALRQNEDFVLMPWFCNLSMLAKGLLPPCVCDAMASFFGVNAAMDDFQGRAGRSS